MRSRLHGLLIVLSVLFGVATAALAEGGIAVEGERLVVTTPDGERLAEDALIGATLTMKNADGVELAIRVDAATPAKEDASILLLNLSVRDAERGEWQKLCEPDAYGRSAGFPVAGAWNGSRFVADKSRWFITCTSGSQGKCILWGYDPWHRGPHHEDLIPYYEACQHMVRADYDGTSTPHTKNGTIINMWDHIGIETRDPDPDDYAFEAGWAPDGAVCVAKTRWRDLLTLSDLKHTAPRLTVPCTEELASGKGALLFNRSR